LLRRLGVSGWVRPVERFGTPIESLEPRCLLSTFVVDNIFTDDESDGNFTSNDLTLREAVEQANLTPGTDTIVFSTLLDGEVIDLTLGELVITDDLIIRGYSKFDVAQSIVLDAGDAQRIFNVAPGVSLTIDNLTLTAGNDSTKGGSILARGDLTLIDTTITASAAARGGAVFGESASTLTISGSTFSGNEATATSGGALTALGPLTIRGSTFSGNIAASDGGAIELQANGTLTGVTLSGNTAGGAGGGLFIGAGAVTLNNSTLTLNRSNSDASGSEAGGGLKLASGSLALTSTLISGNYRGPGVSTSDDIAGTVTGTFNLIGDASSAGGLIHGVGNNLVGVAAQLGTLAFNGGNVQTHPLLDGSQAINTGANPGALANDSRNGRYLRDDGNGIDIGAYERQTLNLVVAHLNDESNGDDSDANLSLREAIAIANINPVADTITFASTLSGTSTLNGSALTITDVVTITGLGASTITLDANGASRIFEIDQPVGTLSGPVFIEGLTLTGGTSTGSGGAILSLERLTLFEVVITANAAVIGGGVYSTGQLIIADSTISNNTATSGGGGVVLDTLIAAPMAIARSTITNNTSGGSGGGVLALGGGANVTIFDSTISDNTITAGSGAGLALLTSGTFSLTNSTINANSISIPGGGSGAGAGIFIGGPTSSTITTSTISANTGADAGGGVYLSSGSLTVTLSTISGNVSLSQGGGLFTSTGTVSISSTTIAFNRADIDSSFVGGDRGGGLFIDGATVTLVSTIVAANTGGGSSLDDVQGVLDATNSMYNLIEHAGSSGGLVNATNNNLIGADANLAALSADLGTTATHALLSGSGAISAGLNPDSAALDQAGQVRSKGLGVDIGAREADLAPTVTVSVPGTSLAGGAIVELGAIPQDEDGVIAQVQWFRDLNGDGIADASELIATDLDGSDGWQISYTVPVTVDPVVGLIILAVALDNDNNKSPVAQSDPIVVNALPTFDLLDVFEDEINRGSKVTVILNNVSDPDGSVFEVRFYLDDNNDGIADEDEYVRSDFTSSSGTFATTIRIPITNPAGQQGFIAVVTDNRGATIATNVAFVDVLNIAPTLNVLATPSSSFAQGDFVTLTASGVADVDGDGVVSAVRFYYDLNADGIPDDDELIATDSDDSNGFVIVLTREQTRILPLGTVIFLAVAVDSEGGLSDAQTTASTVIFSLLANENTTVQTSAGPGDRHNVLSINQSGDVVAFEQSSDQQSWTAIQFARTLGAPPAIDDAITWVDPKDSLTYAAYPSDGGLVLLKRDASGTWSFRNLTEELDGAIGPVRNLTQFVSAIGTGQVVFIGGIDQDGRLVGYQQLTPGQDQAGVDLTPDDYSYEFVDISASLDVGDFDTPVYTELISYRTAWDSWHLAGLDEAGDIVSVWISPSVFTEWRADNLSQINGSARLVGGLTAILTSWSGINLTGLNEQGEVVVTWWIPTFGGDWENANLTDSFDGPRIVGQGLTGYYTSWDGMNYAGLDENNQIVIYWWVPAFGGQWTTSTITDIGDFSIPRPTGQLTSLASDAGTLSILGSSANGDVVRASWQADQGGDWLLENLSQDTQRI